MQSNLNIAVLMGGPDAERAVSIDSGRAVAEALRANDAFNVTEHIIDDPNVPLPVRDVDVFFPALHGPWGEGGPLQRLLDITGIPYVGSGPDASELAMDKWRTKQALEHLPNFRTPSAATFDARENCPIEPPVVLKPFNDGSSVDVFICHDRDALRAAQQQLSTRATILAERYVNGRELTIGILNGQPLPIIEIVPQVAFYDYDAKYHSDATRYVTNPELNTNHAQQCIDMAMAAFNSLGCRDLARVDFMCDDTGPWFLELNTMPGFTSHSLLPKAAAAAGIGFPDLCTRLVNAALSRAPSRV